MSKNNNTQKIVGLGLFTAIVIVLQLMGSFIRFGTFSISLVLVPVVIGAALYGAGAGAWLGFVFGVVVLLSGDAAAFLGVNALGTILTVLVKGTLAGLLSGLPERRFFCDDPVAEGVGFLGSNDIAAARPFLLVTGAGDRPFLCAGVVCGILLPYLPPRSLQFACSTQVVVPPEQLTVSLRV